MSTFSTLQKCIALAAFGTGVLSAAPCATATLDTYLALPPLTGCTITATTVGGHTVIVTFHNFQFQSISFGLPAADLLVTPLADANGIGFQFTPSVTWSAPLFYRKDDQIEYIATVTQNASDWLGINRLYSELQGTVNNPGFDVMTEVFCPGGTTLPPDQLCPGANGQAQTIYVGPSAPNAGTLTVFLQPHYGVGLNGTCDNASKLCTYPSIALLKDIDASASLGGGAAITSVKNQVGPPITCACP